MPLAYTLASIGLPWLTSSRVRRGMGSANGLTTNNRQIRHLHRMEALEGVSQIMAQRHAANGKPLGRCLRQADPLRRRLDISYGE
jgi:hypothetical protein